VDELDESESSEESTGAVEALERDDIPGVSDSECRCPCAHANGRQLTDTQPGKPWSGVRRRRSVLRTRRRAERPDDDELFASDAADDTNGCRGRAAAEPTSQQSVNTAAQPWQCARTNAFEPAALCRVPALLRPFALALVIQPRSGGTGLGSAAGLRPLVPSGPAIKAARSGATRRQRQRGSGWDCTPL
jgi:hypothetical protein